MSPELARARAEEGRARTRLLQLRSRTSRLEEKEAPCSLCRAGAGRPCVKPSGVPTRPHAERRRAASE